MFDSLKGTVTPQDWLATGLILVLGAVLCVAFYFFVYGPQQEKIQEIETQDAEVVANLEQARQTEENYDELKAKAEMVQQLVEEFEERLPLKREVVTLVREFESLADDLGLQRKISSDTSYGDTRKETFPYEVEVRGNFHQIVTFINELERSKRYLKITDLQIARDQDGLSEAKFTLNTYRFKQSAQAGGTS